jgi:hypothetical protein
VTPDLHLDADQVFDSGARQRKEAKAPNPKRTPAQELSFWWMSMAENEVGQTVAKAIEYGSTDLIDIGRSMARYAGRGDALTDQEAALLGVFFYLEGKLSRWRSAITRGELPSRDTLLDIGVYARMAQRIMDTGGWPGTESTDGES